MIRILNAVIAALVTIRTRVWCFINSVNEVWYVPSVALCPIF